MTEVILKLNENNSKKKLLCQIIIMPKTYSTRMCSDFTTLDELNPFA